jgi:hypothetical protein
VAVLVVQVEHALVDLQLGYRFGHVHGVPVLLRAV